MSARKTKQKGTDRHSSGEPPLMPKAEVARFLQEVGQRAWTDAEKELDNIRLKSDGGQWSRGYVKALEGLLLTFRTGDDKYIYLPRILASATKETVTNLRTEFAQLSSSDIHGDYDRGYFKALEEFLSLTPDDQKLPIPAPTPDEKQENLEKPPNQQQKLATSVQAQDEE